MIDESREQDEDWEGEELDPVETLEDLLEEIAEGLRLEVDVQVEESDGVLTGRLEGDDLGLFIGRRGQTIDAVQHLAQRIVFPDGPSPVRVVIDADGYRERRAESLRADADDAAAEVLASGDRWSSTRCPPGSDGSCTSTCATTAAWPPTARAMSPTGTWSSRSAMAEGAAKRFT